ncbi:LysR family transcriptional regulator [Providencia rettgeri]|nr:LysR family transcriptional regulator [Providencia rettgeri]MDH2370123.1 LysR family transcriptional regulator [Providencia rettgeri]
MTCGSLTRAAEVLHISQPAASKALKTCRTTTWLSIIPTDKREVNSYS